MVGKELRGRVGIDFQDIHLVDSQNPYVTLEMAFILNYLINSGIMDIHCDYIYLRQIIRLARTQYTKASADYPTCQAAESCLPYGPKVCRVNDFFVNQDLQ
jgi:hypothetical protein